MSLFIRCEWLAPDSIEDRIRSAVSLLDDAKVKKLAGPQWYFLGRSRKEALSKPLALEDMSEVKNWRSVPIISDESFYGLDLWSGREHPQAANLSIVINTAPNRLNTFVVSSLDIAFLSSGISWNDVMSCARLLAERLGGFAIVSAHELLDYARDSDLPTPQSAAYAAFWGSDKSGNNPHHKSLIKQGLRLPFEMVACDSWQEVKAPDRNRLIALIDLLSTRSTTQ